MRIDGETIQKVFAQSLEGSAVSIQGPLESNAVFHDENWQRVSEKDRAKLLDILANGSDPVVLAKYDAKLSGEWGPKRTILVPLEDPVTAEVQVGDQLVSITYTTFKIKGANIQAGKPVESLVNKDAKQPSVFLDIQNGMPKHHNYLPRPNGAQRELGAVIEDAAIARHNAILNRNYTVNLRIARGTLTNKTFSYIDAQNQPASEKLGYVVSLITDENDQRFYHQIGPKLNEFFDRWQAKVMSGSVTSEEKKQIEQELKQIQSYFKTYGRVAREFNQDSFHSSLSPGNLNFIKVGDMEVPNIQDIDYAIPHSVFPRTDRLGFFINEVYMLLEGIHEFENPVKPDERGRHPTIYRNRHKEVFAFYRKLNEMGLEVNFQKTALDAYFQKVDRSLSVTDLQGQAIGTVGNVLDVMFNFGIFNSNVLDAALLAPGHEISRGGIQQNDSLLPQQKLLALAVLQVFQAEFMQELRPETRSIAEIIDAIGRQPVPVKDADTAFRLIDQLKANPSPEIIAEAEAFLRRAEARGPIISDDREMGMPAVNPFTIKWGASTGVSFVKQGFEKEFPAWLSRFEGGSLADAASQVSNGTRNAATAVENTHSLLRRETQRMTNGGTMLQAQIDRVVRFDAADLSGTLGRMKEAVGYLRDAIRPEARELPEETRSQLTQGLKERSRSTVLYVTQAWLNASQGLVEFLRSTAQYTVRGPWVMMSALAVLGAIFISPALTLPALVASILGPIADRLTPQQAPDIVVDEGNTVPAPTFYSQLGSAAHTIIFGSTAKMPEIVASREAVWNAVSRLYNTNERRYPSIEVVVVNEGIPDFKQQYAAGLFSELEKRLAQLENQSPKIYSIQFLPDVDGKASIQVNVSPRAEAREMPEAFAVPLPERPIAFEEIAEAKSVLEAVGFVKNVLAADSGLPSKFEAKRFPSVNSIKRWAEEELRNAPKEGPERVLLGAVFLMSSGVSLETVEQATKATLPTGIDKSLNPLLTMTEYAPENLLDGEFVKAFEFNLAKKYLAEVAQTMRRAEARMTKDALEKITGNELMPITAEEIIKSGGFKEGDVFVVNGNVHVVVNDARRGMDALVYEKGAFSFRTGIPTDLADVAEYLNGKWLHRDTNQPVQPEMFHRRVGASAASLELLVVAANERLRNGKVPLAEQMPWLTEEVGFWNRSQDQQEAILTRILWLRERSGNIEKVLAKQDTPPSDRDSLKRLFQNFQSEQVSLESRLPQGVLAALNVVRAEARSIVQERQKAFSEWIEENVERVDTLENTTTEALKAMGIDETKLDTPALKVAVVLTRGLVSLKDLPQAMALLDQIARLVDAGTYKGLIAQLAQAVPNARVTVNNEECVVAEILEDGLGNADDFVTTLKFNWALNPGAVFPFLSLGGRADEVIQKEIMAQVVAWGKEINNPNIAGQVEIQIADMSSPAAAAASLKKFQKAIAKAIGKNNYVLAATRSAMAKLNFDERLVAKGAYIEKNFDERDPAKRNAARNVLTKKAHAIRGVAADKIGEVLDESVKDGGIEGNQKRGFSITDASLTSVYANLKALYEAFKTIAKAA
jgi:hypothetical protein